MQDQAQRLVGNTVKVKVHLVELMPDQVYYGFASDEKKTWFISSNKNLAFKDLYLLMELKAKVIRQLKVSAETATTYPTPGDIICTIEGQLIEVLEAKLL